MKNIFKSIFNLKTILSCYVGAIGYGLGYNLPNKYNLHPIICLISCLLLGMLFDYLANKLLSTNYFNGSLQNKITTASFIYFGYLAAWLTINRILEYDLDNDFLYSIGSIIIIQIVLFIIKLFKEYIKTKKNYKKEIADEQLNKVSGGVEPEEFGWKTKGYQTPTKDQTIGNQWYFEAIGDKEEYKNDNK